MANPYKKSSNPYKKAEQVEKKAPGSRPVVADPVPVEEVVPAPVTKPVETPKIEEVQVVAAPVVEEKPVEPIKENEIIETDIKKNLLAGMIEKKPRGKNVGFYLDEEVVVALEKLAKQTKSNKSKVLNTLLRNLLIDNN